MLVQHPGGKEPGGREQEAGNWWKATGGRELEGNLAEGNWKKGTGGRELEEGNWGKGTGRILSATETLH